MSIVCKISSRVFTLKVFVSMWMKLVTGCSKNITKAINLQSILLYDHNTFQWKRPRRGHHWTAWHYLRDNRTICHSGRNVCAKSIAIFLMFPRFQIDYYTNKDKLKNSRHHVLFYLRWIKPVTEHSKLPKYMAIAELLAGKKIKACMQIVFLC